MEFIFMLTRDDQTVSDGLAVLAAVAPVGLGHLGFKDLGAEPASLHALTQGIREQGAISYLEVVATHRDAALQSARMAVELGVDRLLGGVWVEETLAILAGTGIDYFPFPGKPVGHPTDLLGDTRLVAEHCQRFMALGCAGVDLLAYRALEADPLDLTRAARDALGEQGLLICAGSVNSPQRIHDLAAAGADLFTIGSAAFDGSFSPRHGLLQSQLSAIIQATEVRS